MSHFGEKFRLVPREAPPEQEPQVDDVEPMEHYAALAAVKSPLVPSKLNVYVSPFAMVISEP